VLGGELDVHASEFGGELVGRHRGIVGYASGLDAVCFAEGNQAICALEAFVAAVEHAVHIEQQGIVVR
jgi:hypothetical protein